MEELHWLAGIWEGEGTVTVYNQIDKRTKRNHLLPLVEVSNTDVLLMNEVRKILEKFNLSFHFREYKNKKGSTKPVYNLRTNRSDYIKTFLELVSPYMRGEKKAKAELVLAFVSRRIERLSPVRDTRKAEYDVADYIVFNKIRSSETTREAPL